MKRFWLIGLGGLGLMIFAGMIVAGLSGKRSAVEEFDAVGNLVLIRAVVYLLVVAFWYYIAPIKIVPKKPDQDRQEQADTQNKRASVRRMTWKVALFIALFEVIAVQKLGIG